jgi:drug/metabolite transporter (DMT)-like permease
VGVGLALVSALAYGAADFLGGMASRRTPAVVVVVLSQVAGAIVLAAAFPFVPSRLYSEDVGWGVASGVCGAVGIAALYAALASSRMGIVSPVTAVIAASVPVAFGLLTGGRPAPLALAGVALAFVAVGLVSAGPGVRGVTAREPGLWLAVVSGVAIGGLYIFLSRGHADAGLWLVAVTRATSILLLIVYLLARRERPLPDPGRGVTIVVAGVLDMSANVLYVLATHRTLLAVAAVITSLYPASTVFLARIVLRERLGRVQWAGVACAACGVLLIAWTT